MALLPLMSAALSAQSIADFQYRKVSAVNIHADGPVDVPFLLDLIEITPNVDILTASKVRASIRLLYQTGNFTNILVEAEPDGDRVSLTFVLRLVYRFQYIHLKGDLGVSAGTIRRKLRLRKLEPYSPEKVLKGREDILAVLKDYGYFNARITQDVLLHRSAKRAEVTFHIQAGPPSYVATLNFLGEKHYSDAVLRKTVHARPSKRYREFDFKKDMDRLDALYNNGGFLEHNIKVTEKALDRQFRMHLGITIDAGKQLILAVDGFSLSEDVLHDQVPIWIDRSYNDDTLEEGKRNLFVYLQTRGYYDASVEWEKKIEKEKILIRYVIKPGTQYEISEIKLTGNEHFPTNEIRELMKTTESGLITKGRLVTRIFEADIAHVLSAYRERGFLFATFAKQDVHRGYGGKLNIDLEIREEKQVIVSAIDLKGNEIIPTSDFLQHFRQKVGEPLSQSKVKNDSNYIVALYSDKGYPKIKLDTRIRPSPDKTRARVEYSIQEGQEVFVDRIVINGNWRTQRDVVTKNLYFSEDDPLSLRKIQESQSKLYSLYIFDRVDIEMPRPDNLERYQDVVVKVTESKPYTISYGFGFETYNKLRGVFTLSNRNLFGSARSGTMQLRGGFKEGRLLFTYNDPQLFSAHTLSTLSIFAERRSLRDSFSYRSYGINIEVEKKLSPEASSLEIGQSPPPQKSLFFGYRFEDIDTFGTPTLSPLDRQFLAIHISSLSSSFARDARDNAIDPTTGNFLSTDLEWSTSLLGSESDYLKAFSWLQYYLPFRRTVTASSFRLGLARGFKETISLPISQRFFAGGGRTIRGFDLDTAGPLDPDGQPLGGNMLFVLNLEDRFPIYHNLGGVIFFDWGNVFDLIEDFRFSDLRETTGLGLRYKTPIGPLSFDWGYKLDRRPRESAYEFYLSIGNAF